MIDNNEIAISSTGSAAGAEDVPLRDGSAAAGRDISELPAVMTVEETARFLRLDVKTVRQSIANGELPGRKVGRRTVVLRDALLQWLMSKDRVLPRRRSR